MTDREKKTEFNKNRKKNVMDVPLSLIGMMGAPTDPNGSYTGVPINPFEDPVQDADDL